MQTPEIVRCWLQYESARAIEIVDMARAQNASRTNELVRAQNMTHLHDPLPKHA